MVLLPLLAAGCGEGDTGSKVIGGTVTGEVSYSGSEKGELIVAAFLEWPTLWAPEMFVKIPSPSYPQAYKLEGLDPGDYYIFAFIDAAPVSPTIPGDEDIKSEPTQSTHVTDTEPGVADITLPAK
jgi:hypothetical protein